MVMVSWFQPTTMIYDRNGTKFARCRSCLHFELGANDHICLPTSPTFNYLVVKLVGVDVVDVLLGVTLGPLTVDEVQALGLDLPVDEGTGKASHDLLGLVVALGLA